jgi:hypothetical protein
MARVAGKATKACAAASEFLFPATHGSRPGGDRARSRNHCMRTLQTTTGSRDSDGKY